MPDLYARGDYDLAGFCVGVVERARLIDGTRDLARATWCWASASSGLHSNGYSLVRKIVFDIAGLSVDDHVDELRRRPSARRCSTPTRLYVRPVRQRADPLHGEAVVHGIAHITGGGLQENLERILPDGMSRRDRRGQLAHPARASLAATSWATSTTTKWTASSTWASAWCWS